MPSKFAEFLEKNKIDPRRLLAASYELERLRPDDRAVKLRKRQAKSGDGTPPAAGEEKAAPKKPRSGRPVTRQSIEAARLGKTVSGPTKTRMVRALNHLLTQKKQAAVELRTLF